MLSILETSSRAKVTGIRDARLLSFRSMALLCELFVKFVEKRESRGNNSGERNEKFICRRKKNYPLDVSTE